MVVHEALIHQSVSSQDELYLVKWYVTLIWLFGSTEHKPKLMKAGDGRGGL